MFRKIYFLAFAILTAGNFYAQKTKTTSADKPKLVVGIVVDQMRWDYLYRYQNHYGNGGFNRLLNDGYTLNNVMINYVPTVTAIGHTSIYTGSVPSIHGIAGNDWTNRETGEDVYCTADTSVKGVGSTSEKIGAHSPKNLWSTTITDQVRLASNFRAKVVGISLKDRASILPAGHNPTGAFWFDEGSGHFITSSYYMNDLPAWLKDFNNQNWGEKLVANGWNTIKPIAEYKESSADDVPWEYLLGSAKSPVFPYSSLAADYAAKKGIIRTTPFGNTLTLKAAEAALDGYQLGKGNETDFLAINLASTDYVGHSFGPNSVEVEDTYIRLDSDLEAFFKVLDQKIGKGEYLVFLSADHGGAHSEGFMEANKMKTGFFDTDLKKNIEEDLKTKYGYEKMIWGIDNYQIYLNQKLISEKNLDEEDIKKQIISKLNKDPRFLYVVDMKKVAESSIPEPIKSRIINGFNWQRSGDIQLITHDGMLPQYAKKGTTHSVWNSYDSHIPLIFMGKGAGKGASSKPYHMTDIAPTIAQILKIENPSGTVGEPIVEAMQH
ncbi:MAG: alkaline phosphatase family protein [Bergeyella sp.]